MIEYKLETNTPGETGAAGNVSIIGVGGAGANVIDHIALEGMEGVDLISMNCDVRALTSSMAARKVQLGKNVTQGLGCGGDPELGQESAVGSLAEIREALTGRRMVFLCAGLGGGTGSGAAPVIARLARESGAFVIVFATMPFVFEGKRRMLQAQGALDELRQYANALVTFENDKMGELVLPKKGVNEAFEVANKMICQSVRAVSTVATQPGLIRIGMDDLITALKNADSRCLFGFGQARGEARATEALTLALKSPLLDRGQLLDKARNVLVHVCGGASLTLFEIESLMKELTKHVSAEAQILFGAASDPKLGDQLSVTIISSVGRAKAAPVEAKPEVNVAPAPAPAVRPPVATVPIMAFTQPVPVVSVQPRKTAGPASEMQEGQNTITKATSTVPVLKMTASLDAPPVPVKPLKPAPLTNGGPVKPRASVVPQPELFAPPAVAAEPEPQPEVLEAVAEVEEEIVYVAEPVSEAPAPVEEFIVEEQVEEFVAEEELVEEIEEEFVAEEEIVPEPEIEEEMVAEEEVIEEQFIEAPVAEEEFVEEIEMEDEPPAAPQHPAFLAEQRPAPMKPMDVPAPVQKHAAQPQTTKKFDLREILQRQRQNRLGNPQAPQKPEAPAAPVQPQRPAAQSPQPAAPRPAQPAPAPAPQRQAPERTPNPDRIPPIRPIPATTPVQPARATAPSPFVPVKAPPQRTYAQPAPAAQQQVTFDERLTPATRGRFDKSEPTVEEGEDLDIPTFLRKKR